MTVIINTVNHVITNSTSSLVPTIYLYGHIFYCETSGFIGGQNNGRTHFSLFGRPKFIDLLIFPHQKHDYSAHDSKILKQNEKCIVLHLNVAIRATFSFGNPVNMFFQVQNQRGKNRTTFFLPSKANTRQQLGLFMLRCVNVMKSKLALFQPSVGWSYEHISDSFRYSSFITSEYNEGKKRMASNIMRCRCVWFYVLF